MTASPGLSGADVPAGSVACTRCHAAPGGDTSGMRSPRRTGAVPAGPTILKFPGAGAGAATP